MTTYNSYEAAKIANPAAVIYKSTGRCFGTNESLNPHASDVYPCNPADHCKTLGWLRANHGFESAGDIIIGHVSHNVIEITQDKIKDYDGKCLILRAAALEEKSSEKVEWVNGDECVFTDKNGDEKTCKVIGLYPPFVESYVLHCENTNPTFFISNVGRMVKPETEQQREDRERLEAAYDLYTHVQSVQGQLSCKSDWFYNSEMEETRLRFLAIVDKTNYRKEV